MERPLSNVHESLLWLALVVIILIIFIIVVIV